jgi:hypothetical protein
MERNARDAVVRATWFEATLSAEEGRQNPLVDSDAKHEEPAQLRSELLCCRSNHDRRFS